MIDKNEILKFAKHVYKRGRGIPDRKLLHPKRDWSVALLIFVVTTSAGGLLSLHLFDTYRNVRDQQVEISQEIPAYKETLVKNVLEKYVERERLYDASLKSVSTIQLSEEPATSTSTSEVSDTEEEISVSSEESATGTEAIENATDPEPEDDTQDVIRLDAS